MGNEFDSIDVKGANRQICIPCSQEKYAEIFEDTHAFRLYLDQLYKQFPEIFPKGMENGYCFNGKQAESKKIPGFQLRTILIKTDDYGSVFYTIRPSFVLPYTKGLTFDVEKALFIMKFGVPMWAITYVFGRNDSYWERLKLSLGRNSIVGTTVKDPEKIPTNISADEKHTSLKGEKVYVATTVGNNCVLGASVSESAGTKDLTEAYGIFRDEAQNVNPDYQTESANFDGWEPTSKAWYYLFPRINIITCFLHAYMSIRRKCGKKKFQAILNIIGDKVWTTYKAETKRCFSQRIRRLREWAKKNLSKDDCKEILSKVMSLCSKKESFLKSFDIPGAHRTSNMVDRLMRWQDEFLFNRQYFHGSLGSAELAIRSWAILTNFCPLSPRALGKNATLMSPAERLNGFKYRDNWLENLLISASLGGYT